MSDKLFELIAKWRKEADHSMRSEVRELHLTAASQQVCADELEAALAATPEQAPRCGHDTTVPCPVCDGAKRNAAQPATKQEELGPTAKHFAGLGTLADIVFGAQSATEKQVASPAAEGESIATVPSTASTSNGPTYDPWDSKETSADAPSRSETCSTCGRSKAKVTAWNVQACPECWQIFKDQAAPTPAAEAGTFDAVRWLKANMPPSVATQLGFTAWDIEIAQRAYAAGQAAKGAAAPQQEGKDV